MTQKKIIIVTIVVSVILSISIVTMVFMPKDTGNDREPINAVWYYTAEPTYSLDETTEYGGTLRIEVVDDKIANLTYQITSKAVTDPSVIPKKSKWNLTKPLDPAVPYTDLWYRMNEIKKLPIVEGLVGSWTPHYLDDQQTMLAMNFCDYSSESERYFTVREDGMILEVRLTKITPDDQTMTFIKDL